MESGRKKRVRRFYFLAGSSGLTFGRGTRRFHSLDRSIHAIIEDNDYLGPVQPAGDVSRFRELIRVISIGHFRLRSSGDRSVNRGGS